MPGKTAAFMAGAYSRLTKAANPVMSTMKGTGRADLLSARRAFGGAMNHIAGGGSVSSAAKGMGRDLMRDVGGKRLAGYGAAGGAAGMWGLSD
jgi:hypothetical protein